MSSKAVQANQIHYREGPKQNIEEELLSSEENYIFRTYPSFMSSEDQPKMVPPSKNFLKEILQKQFTHNQKLSQTKTQFHLQVTHNPMNPEIHQHYEDNSKQVQNLQKEIKTLKEKNDEVMQENLRLRKYVQFLQDYNMMLKNQLMNSLKKRNSDQHTSLHMYHDSNHAKQRHEEDQGFRKKYISRASDETAELNSHIYQLNPNMKSNYIDLTTSHKDSPIFYHNDFSATQFKNSKHDISTCLSKQYNNLQNEHLFSSIDQSASKIPYYIFERKRKNKHIPKKVYPVSLNQSLLDSYNDVWTYNGFGNSNLNHNLNSLNTSLPVINQDCLLPVSNQKLAVIFKNQRQKSTEKLANHMSLCQKCQQKTKKMRKNKNQSTQQHTKLKKSIQKQFSCADHKKQKNKAASVPKQRIGKQIYNRKSTLKEEVKCQSCMKNRSKVITSQFCV